MVDHPIVLRKTVDIVKCLDEKYDKEQKPAIFRELSKFIYASSNVDFLSHMNIT